MGAMKKQRLKDTANQKEKMGSTEISLNNTEKTEENKEFCVI